MNRNATGLSCNIAKRKAKKIPTASKWPVTYRFVAMGTLMAYSAFGASKVTLAPNEPVPSSRFEAIFRDQEFDRYQGQARVQSYADAAFRSIPDRERENVIQNTEESPAIARRPLERSLVKFVFEVAQHSHTNPSQKIAQAEYVWASRSLRTLTGTAQLSRTKTPTVTRAHRNQD